MAHEIETHTDGTAAFVSARQHAWHGLGTVLPAEFTAEQAMEHAHLGGWNVRCEPITAQVTTAAGAEVDMPVDNRFAVVRDNPFTTEPEIFTVVGSQWAPVQNEEHAEFLNDLVDEGGAHFETAGSLRGGRQVFVTMKLPRTMRIGGVDDIDLYIAAMNSHDGTSGFRTIVTPVRVVCANTQAAALRQAKTTYTVRHTQNIRRNMQQAREALDLTFTWADAFEVEAEKMIQETLTARKFDAMIERVFGKIDKDAPERTKAPKIERVETIKGLMASGTQHEIRGTRWAGYQAIVEYIDHFAPVRGAEGAEAQAKRSLRAVDDPAMVGLKRDAFEAMKV